MPHHHGRSGRSMNVKQGTQSHHGLSQGTPVSSRAITFLITFIP